MRRSADEISTKVNAVQIVQILLAFAIARVRARPYRPSVAYMRIIIKKNIKKKVLAQPKLAYQPWNAYLCKDNCKKKEQ